MTQRFFLHDSFVYKYSSASLKYFITRATNLFITVMSELLTKGCVSFCCSHPSSSPRFIAQLLGRRSGLVEALESAENKSVFPFRKKSKTVRTQKQRNNNNNKKKESLAFDFKVAILDVFR